MSMGDEETLKPERSTYILNVARWTAVIGNAIGVGAYKSAEMATKLSPELDGGVIRVIGLAFIVLASLGYLSGVHAANNPFVPEDSSTIEN